MREIYKTLIIIFAVCVAIITSFLIGWQILGTDYVYDPSNFFAGLGILMLFGMFLMILLGVHKCITMKMQERTPLIENEL